MASLVAAARLLDTLIVLDNREHVIAGAAEVPEALVLGCPHARLLVTSREPLAVVGRTTGAIGESDPAAAKSSALLTATLQTQLRPEVLFALQAAGAQLELDHAVDKALAASRST